MYDIMISLFRREHEICNNNNMFRGSLNLSIEKYTGIAQKLITTKFEPPRCFTVDATMYSSFEYKDDSTVLRADY